MAHPTPTAQTGHCLPSLLKDIAELEHQVLAIPAAAAEPESAPDVAASATDTDSGGQTQAKTLKCAECGELNRPTEWYCERCGAELASL